jgi:ATP-binding cassette subfamily C (CFTR/MRP) protein 4
VTFGSYARYLVYNKKYWLMPIMFLIFLMAQGCNTAYYRILAYYDAITAKQYTLTYDQFWLTLGILALCDFIIKVLKFYTVNIVALRSNERLHNDMIFGLLRSPSSYFDTTPTGRLINRFSNDMSIIDNLLAFTLIDTLEGPILLLVLLVNVFQILPVFIVPGVANLVFLGFWFFYCKPVIIQTKQLDLRAKSPVFTEFALITTGITQNRIYGQVGRVTNEMSDAINKSVRANYSFWFSSRVFVLLTNYVSVVVISISFFVGIEIIPSAGLYGVTVIFLMQMSDTFQLFLRQVINMESIMVSVERGAAVTNLAPEADLRTDYDRSLGFQDEIEEEKHETILKSRNPWPANASIEFKNFTMCYRPGLPPVLNNINFQIGAGQKVGIVGRTGAGKSSIIQALFRMVTPDAESKLMVGGSDAQLMGLHSLRRNLSIIPQTPFLFRGSIRQNIDPFNEYPEEKLWEALRESDLADYVQTVTAFLMAAEEQTGHRHFEQLRGILRGPEAAGVPVEGDPAQQQDPCVGRGHLERGPAHGRLHSAHTQDQVPQLHHRHDRPQTQHHRRLRYRHRHGEGQGSRARSAVPVAH